jgi:hypothetical protein
MTTPITVSTAMKALWFRKATREKHGGQDKGDIIAVRYTSLTLEREWVIRSPSVWYQPAVTTGQGNDWKEKDQVDLTIVLENLNLGADTHHTHKYLPGRFLAEDGNVLVDPFHTGPQATGAGTAAVQTNIAAAGGEEDDEEGDEGYENEEEYIIEPDSEEEEDEEKETIEPDSGEEDKEEEEEQDEEEKKTEKKEPVPTLTNKERKASADATLYARLTQAFESPYGDRKSTRPRS